ncbi:outer membrane lipoprotein [Salmonella phage STP4-a]|uniref:Outer membrane lipoprotein n=1 Tax=Salmonella phage STP4-a TaxID=1445860 RepID=A0A0B4L938_9CAUD|nr:Rz-like spanin [Salmonella phage STP4-a]AHJ86809.1 outer membrane lipoprotein [Salmonella phage STP4-a]
MIRNMLLIVSMALLIGCASKPEAVPKPLIHPSWPEPISAWNGNWEVKVIDGEAWVGMPFAESQEMRIWLNDVSRYVKDANATICYYRKDLNEERCK